MLREQFYFHTHRKKIYNPTLFTMKKKEVHPEIPKTNENYKKTPTYIFRLFRTYMEIASVGRTMFEIIPTMECYTLHIYLLANTKLTRCRQWRCGWRWRRRWRWYFFRNSKMGRLDGWMYGWLVGTTNVQSKNICSFLNIIISDRKKTTEEMSGGCKAWNFHTFFTLHFNRNW